MIVVPEAFAIATVAREGEAGRAWIDGLPDLVAALCRRWGLAVDGLPMHGYLGVVVPVRHGDERDVLKVAWPDHHASAEAIALAAWGGQGAVLLRREDRSSAAMLLERLDFRRCLLDVDIDEAVRVAGRLLRRLAVPAPDQVPTLATISAELARDLPGRWERYGRPMSRHVLDRACDLLNRLGPSSGKRLVNYDLHYADVLAGEREQWLAVDPKVVAGDAEFGVAQLLFRRLEDIEAHGGLERHFAALVDAAELDLERARSWTLVRCVDYWLWGLSIGLTYDPARCERIVEWLVR